MSNLNKNIFQIGLLTMLIMSIYSNKPGYVQNKFSKYLTPVHMENSADLSNTVSPELFAKLFSDNINAKDLNLKLFEDENKNFTLISVDNKNILINTGNIEITKRLINYLKSQNISQIDYLIFTLPSKENISGATELLKNISVDKVISPIVPEMYSEELENLIIVMKQNNKSFTQLELGEKLALGRANLNVINIGNNSNEESLDNNSLIFSIDFLNKTILFINETNKNKLDNLNLPHCDILKTNIQNVNFLNTILPKITPANIIYSIPQNYTINANEVDILNNSQSNLYQSNKNKIVNLIIMQEEINITMIDNPLI